MLFDETRGQRSIGACLIATVSADGPNCSKLQPRLGAKPTRTSICLYQRRIAGLGAKPTRTSICLYQRRIAGSRSSRTFPQTLQLRLRSEDDQMAVGIPTSLDCSIPNLLAG